MRINGVPASTGHFPPANTVSVTATNVGTGRPWNDGAVNVVSTPPAATTGKDAVISFRYVVTTSGAGTTTVQNGAVSDTITGLSLSLTSGTTTVTSLARNGYGLSTTAATSTPAFVLSTVPNIPQAQLTAASATQLILYFNASPAVSDRNSGRSAITSRLTTLNTGASSTSTTSGILFSGLTTGTTYTANHTMSNVNGSSLPAVDTAVARTPSYLTSNTANIMTVLTSSRILIIGTEAFVCQSNAAVPYRSIYKLANINSIAPSNSSTQWRASSSLTSQMYGAYSDGTSIVTAGVYGVFKYDTSLNSLWKTNLTSATATTAAWAVTSSGAGADIYALVNPTNTNSTGATSVVLARYNNTTGAGSTVANFFAPSGNININGSKALANQGTIYWMFVQRNTGLCATLIGVQTSGGVSIYAQKNIRFGLSQSDPRSIAINDSGIYLTWTSGGTTSVITKLDPTGSTVLWNKQTTTRAFPMAQCFDSSGNLYVAFSSSTGTANNGTVIVKFDSSGNVIWQRIFSNLLGRDLLVNDDFLYINFVTEEPANAVARIRIDGTTDTRTIVPMPLTNNTNGSTYGTTTLTFTDSTLTLENAAFTFNTTAGTYATTTTGVTVTTPWTAIASFI